jgi:uncharacterized cupredoxin-like copper-binding protein
MPTRLVFSAIAAAAITLPLGPQAIAAGDHAGGHPHGQPTDVGKPGEAVAVDRTIEIVMSDNYYEPDRIQISEGETVRFVVKNAGEFLHEFNIGTAAMHIEHQEEMATMMEHGMLTPTGIDEDMMNMDHGEDSMSGHVHDDPNSRLVEPGKSVELIWTFTTDADLEFACNVPGHYETGMMGEIEFVPSHYETGMAGETDVQG